MSTIKRVGTGMYNIRLDGLDLSNPIEEKIEKELNKIKNKLDQMQEEIIEHHLFSDAKPVIDVYKMSYDKYAELPGNVRL